MMGHGAVLWACKSFQKETLAVSLFPDSLLEFYSKLRATLEVVPREPWGSILLHIFKPATKDLKLLFSRLTNPNTIKEPLLLENFNALSSPQSLSVCSGYSLVDLFLS